MCSVCAGISTLSFERKCEPDTTGHQYRKSADRVKTSPMDRALPTGGVCAYRVTLACRT